MSTKRLDCVGRLAFHGVLIPVYCRRCSHFAEVELSSLILCFGWGRDPKALPWRCSRCGASRARVLVGHAARMAR
ncbi:hypothetical protein GAY33_35545 [Azospirillum brasilense]|uniref:hypothetical protein n=1 Tax=Azospirillum argentinense TaxID=2970906 RepID=UPI00190EA2AE|nr:hypothetical protein [Azospirillum argentinense]MBK3804369.1 hypothetical protein [Azospirillum argentinense]